MYLNNSGLTVNGTFVSTSDRNAKENFKPVDPREMLEKVAALPLTEWTYKQDASARHVGPMAQDFYAAFGLGADDKHIATVDAEGIALAAIQGLKEIIDQQSAELGAKDAKIERLEEEITELKNAQRKTTAELAARLAALERAVTRPGVRATVRAASISPL